MHDTHDVDAQMVTFLTCEATFSWNRDSNYELIIQQKPKEEMK